MENIQLLVGLKTARIFYLLLSEVFGKEKVFDIKHFENGTNGNQLLTTETFDFINDTYKCNVREIED